MKSEREDVGYIARVDGPEGKAIMFLVRGAATTLQLPRMEVAASPHKPSVRGF